ncbi:MAG: hypothetical protein HY875_09450 [Chloroflexi bacterium]|nr:hypothetical protein [Chloroflexota bacterium]
MHQFIVAALEETHRQLASLRAGDDTGFVEHAPTHEAACLLVAGLPGAVLAGEAAALASLVEANAGLDDLIAAHQAAAAGRMTALAVSRHAASAYGAALPGSAYPTREA